MHGDGLVQWAFIRELAERGHLITVVAPAVSIVGAVPENVNIHEIPGGETMPLVAYLRHAHAIFRKLHAERSFDVIHQMNPVIRGVTLPWAFSAVPVILGTYVGDWPYEVPMYRLRSAKLGAGLRMALKVAVDATQQALATRLLVATPFALNRIPLPRMLEQKITVLPHGIDVERYSPERRHGDPAIRADSVLFVGQVEPHKGVAVLLAAFDLVHAAMPSARLVIVGSGSMQRTVERYALRAGWLSQLEVIGSVDHDRVAGWLRACSVLCSTALGEPYGQTVLEGLACGIPLVVNDSGGPRFIIAGTENSIVPLGDAEALAQALLTVLRDSDRCTTLRKQNRRLALTRYAWGHVIDALEAVYQGVTSVAPPVRK